MSRCPICRLIVLESDTAEHLERWHGWHSEQGKLMAEMEREAIRNALAEAQRRREAGHALDA